MNLQLYILQALRDVSPFRMTDEALLNQLRLARPEGVDLADLHGELADLAQKHQVRRTPDEDRGALYEILPAGTARLQRNSL